MRYLARSDPSVGCACIRWMVEVVVGALVREGRVLLAHRSPRERAYPSVWDLPGGVVEAGESERAALARELHEELGVEVVTTVRLCRFPAVLAPEPTSVSAWLVLDWRGVPVNAAPGEHDDLGWFDLADLPPLAHAAVRAALADLAKN